MYAQHPENGFSADLFPAGLYFGTSARERLAAVGGTHALVATHRLAVQINDALDAEIHLFGQVRLDAKQLLDMSRAQLLQPLALVLLDDLAAQAQDAYTGQPDPSTSQPGGLRGPSLRSAEGVAVLATVCLRCSGSGEQGQMCVCAEQSP